MLLSLSSAAAEVESDLTSINGTISASDSIPAAQELLNFTDSVHRLDYSLELHRAARIETIGEE